MSDIYLDFLLKKFTSNSYIASDECRESQYGETLRQIKNILEGITSRPSDITEIRKTLIDLNASLELCIQEAQGAKTGMKQPFDWKSCKNLGRSDLGQKLDSLKNQLSSQIEKRPGEINKEKEIDSTIWVIRREALRGFDPHEYPGFEKQIDEISKILYQQGKKAIGIFGTAGSGKSTLAKLIFFSPETRKNFETILWIDLSETLHPNPNKNYHCVFAENYTSPPIKSRCTYTLPELLRKFSYIATNKCLVVLDGVWHAEGIKSFVEEILSSPGEVSVIYTARIVALGKQLVPQKQEDFVNHHHRMEDLSHESCLKILEGIMQRKANVISIPPEEMEKMKEEMATTSHGHPLGLRTLAEVFAYKAWIERVCRDETFYQGQEFITEKETRNIFFRIREELLTKAIKDIVIRLEDNGVMTTTKVWEKLLLIEGVTKETIELRNREFHLRAQCDPSHIVQGLGPSHHIELIEVIKHHKK